MVEKVPPGQPMTQETAELYADLKVRCYAQYLRQAEWRRALAARVH